MIVEGNALAPAVENVRPMIAMHLDIQDHILTLRRWAVSSIAPIPTSIATQAIPNIGYKVVTQRAAHRSPVGRFSRTEEVFEVAPLFAVTAAQVTDLNVEIPTFTEFTAVSKSHDYVFRAAQATTGCNRGLMANTLALQTITTSKIVVHFPNWASLNQVYFS